MGVFEESSGPYGNDTHEGLPEEVLEGLEGLVERVEDAGRGVGYRVTALGWLALARMQSEKGHNVESCDCSLCPKVRLFLGKIYYARCAFCNEHIEAPYIKNGDLLHCARCHRRRCFPKGPPCAGGPLEGVTR